MRMRRMRNLEPRMEKCADYRITDPAALKGNWRSLKPDCTALWVEVGCGKGKFTVETAQANLDVLLIAVERCREAMVVAMEKAQSMGLKNVFYIDMDVANIEEIFAGEEIGAVGTSALLEIGEPPHLHFAVTKNGEPVDPMEYLA